ncbi:MAG: hypothetical protein CV087_18670 [Candidatus Brocadia sp. WS118]|nr:MAG: hypothetical protein CV087_18670 [Candidatus Brocadia sp. WS118]
MKMLLIERWLVIMVIITVCADIMGLKAIGASGPSEEGTKEGTLASASIRPGAQEEISGNSVIGVGRQGRWFTYDDEPTYLVGFDCQELACDPTINYITALDMFVKYRINKVRIWTYCWFGTTSFGALTPWAREPTGLHNLDQWNPAFWARTRDFLANARDRKIVVEITVFAPYPSTDWWWSETRDYHIAWNESNNVNGVFVADGITLFQPEFFDLNHSAKSKSKKRLQDYQKALIDKAVDEFGEYENVYLEVCNEFGNYDLDIDTWHPWQLEWARRIDESTSRMVAVHAGWDKEGPFRPAYYWDKKYVDVMNFRLRGSPQEVSDALHPSQLKGKILSVNETPGSPEQKVDFYHDLDRHTRYAWAIFMAGGHVAFYDDDSSRIGSEGWVEGAKRLKALREIAEKVSFWKLSPVDDTGAEYDRLIKKGPAGANRQLLANPGSEYVAYFWGNQSTKAVRMSLPAGTYSYEWYDVRDASLIGSGKIVGSGAGNVKIAAPATTTWSQDSGLALIIESSN